MDPDDTYHNTRRRVLAIDQETLTDRQKQPSFSALMNPGHVLEDVDDDDDDEEGSSDNATIATTFNELQEGLRRRSDRVEAQRVTVISKFDECRSARTRLLADETAAKMERDKANLDINRLDEERQRKHEDDARKLDKAKRKVMHEIEQLRQANSAMDIGKRRLHADVVLAADGSGRVVQWCRDESSEGTWIDRPLPSDVTSAAAELFGDANSNA